MTNSWKGAIYYVIIHNNLAKFLVFPLLYEALLGFTFSSNTFPPCKLCVDSMTVCHTVAGGFLFEIAHTEWSAMCFEQSLICRGGTAFSVSMKCQWCYENYLKERLNVNPWVV